MILLGHKHSLSKKNLEKILRGGDNIVLAEVSFEELERLEGRRLGKGLES